MNRGWLQSFFDPWCMPFGMLVGLALPPDVFMQPGETYWLWLLLFVTGSVVGYRSHP